MEAVLMTTSRQSSSDASPGGERRAMPRAARMPMGVAAFPSPNRLAETLDAREESISLSRAERGKSRRKTGESARERASSAPARRNTSITPLQRQMSPPVSRQSFTAAGAPSSAAAPVSAALPETAPYTSENRMNTTQIVDMLCTPSSFYLKYSSLYIEYKFSIS